ncbi:MAG TPA: GIY-YIG nuclease family protein, partial [Candidatus Binataceae bacterium]|nr:GIY-YIG nuclease family protein [Candidatus Binataceae bacterium]
MCECYTSVLMGDRISNSRKQAAASIRNAEGLRPSGNDQPQNGDENRARGDAPIPFGEPKGTADVKDPVPKAGNTCSPPGAEQNPDERGGAAGPRFDSLVSYPQVTVEGAQSPDGVPTDDPLSHKLESIPVEPGVYLLKDRNGKVLYVGKAKSLRPRVRAYFRENGDGRMQVRFLMKRVREFDTLVARSEKEALILENNLIKQYKPRYNIRLKDDKSYLSAKITQHAWPRITVTRRIVKDGGRYIGPFGSADGLRETIDVIGKVFPLRTCSDGVFRNRSRPCIEYQIKRCLGPCCLPVDREEYDRHLRG